jgi:hypothetical protein
MGDGEVITMMTAFRRRIIPFLLCQIPLWTAMWAMGRIINEPPPQIPLLAHPTATQVDAESRAFIEALDRKDAELHTLLIAGISFTILAHGVEFWHRRKRGLSAA